MLWFLIISFFSAVLIPAGTAYPNTLGKCIFSYQVPGYPPDDALTKVYITDLDTADVSLLCRIENFKVTAAAADSEWRNIIFGGLALFDRVETSELRIYIIKPPSKRPEVVWEVDNAVLKTLSVVFDPYARVFYVGNGGCYLDSGELKEATYIYKFEPGRGLFAELEKNEGFFIFTGTAYDGYLFIRSFEGEAMGYGVLDPFDRPISNDLKIPYEKAGAYVLMTARTKVGDEILGTTDIVVYFYDRGRQIYNLGKQVLDSIVYSAKSHVFIYFTRGEENPNRIFLNVRYPDGALVNTIGLPPEVTAEDALGTNIRLLYVE